MHRRTNHKATLRQRYSSAEMAVFHQWVTENTHCLPGSLFPLQLTACVARYLWFSSGGRAFDETTVWQYIFSPAKIENWLNELRAAGASPHTVYNHLSCIGKLAATFCYAVRGMQTPTGYEAFVQHKLRLFRRRRRSAALARQGFEDQLGPVSLTPLCRLVLMSSMCLARMTDAIKTAKHFLTSGGQTLSRSDFLFPMRLALVHLMVSVAARPSAIYTLTVDAVTTATGSWSGNGQVLIKSASHKTAETHGPAWLVLSGRGKMVFWMYFSIIRPAALKARGSNSQFVFFNAAAKQLRASSVSANIKKLQVTCGMLRPLTSTDIRKAITTYLRSTHKLPTAPSTIRVASALCHTVVTSDKHYNLGKNIENAVEVHQSIVELLVTFTGHRD